MDLQCEHANKQFQGKFRKTPFIHLNHSYWHACFISNAVGSLRSSHGHVEEAHASRISQLIGSVGEEVEKVFLSRLSCTYVYSGKDHKGKHQDDILKFVKGNKLTKVNLSKVNLVLIVYYIVFL